MKRSLATFAALLIAWPLTAIGEGDMPAPPAARRHELLRLLRQDCGSCHGMRLTGGLGPALTRQALRDKPDDSLVATIVSGRAGTPMPPWKPFMTEDEARWLVERLKEGDTDGK